MIRHSSRRWRAGIAAIVLFMVLASGCSLVNASPPASDGMIQMIAAQEGVKESQVELLASEFKAGEPYALYRLSPPYSQRSPDEVTNLRVFVHPSLRPWEWDIAGGGGANALQPGEGASMSLLSSEGDTGTTINSAIYGVGGPGAASIKVTINGQTYTRDIRNGRGYIILLKQQGVKLSMIDGVQVFDSEGNRLPVPLLWRGFLESGPVPDIDPPQ